MTKMGLIFVFIILVITSATKASTLCVKRNTSCSYQLWQNNSQPLGACRMIYYRPNSVECASFNFQYKPNQNKLDTVKLLAYTALIEGQTLFDIIFTNITWKRTNMKFIQMGLENDNSICRSFKIWENATVSQSTNLIYNCSWAQYEYEGQNVALEFEFHSSEIFYTKLLFMVPFFKYFTEGVDVRLLQLFCYVDVTDSEYLRLHIQTAPVRYNITEYFIEVIRERSNISTRLTVQILSAKEAIDGKLIFEYPTWNEFGYFYFTVTPLNDVCEENVCLKSITPKEFVGRKKSSLVIGIVGASVILFALFYAMFFWNRQKNQREENPHQVLLVYNASVPSHSTVVHNLARFLTDVLRIEVYLFDIPHTSRKNSPLWTSHSFSDASHIILIISPKPAQTALPKADDEIMKFIKKEASSKNSNKQIFVVTFPYAVNDIPSELSHLKPYHLMEDMDSLVSALIKPPYQSWMFLQIYRPNRFTGESQYIDLEDSIKVALREMGISLNESAATSDDGIKDNVRLLNPMFPLAHLNLSGVEERGNDEQVKIAMLSLNFDKLDL